MYLRNKKYNYIVHSAAVILVIVFLLPLFYYPAKAFIFYTQEKILSQLSKDNRKLTKFSFSRETFHQLRFPGNKKEFSFNGMMYDIYSIEKNKDTITIIALADHKETALANSLGKATGQGRDAVKSGIAQLFVSQFWQEPESIQFNLICLNPQPFLSAFKKYTDPYNAPFSPPPKNC